LRSRAWKRRLVGAHYLGHVPQLLRTVQTVALARVIAISLTRLAISAFRGRLAWRWNGEGLDLITAGLRRDAVAVF
jgi:hypothetical protein